MTRKITRAVAKISLGQQESVELGNINSKRDWGHARDYVEVRACIYANKVLKMKTKNNLFQGMWLILQHTESDDFVLATNEMHSVREFVEFAFKEIGMEIE